MKQPNTGISSSGEALARTYAPGTFERKWYDYWVNHNLFKPAVNPGKPKFSLAMPPPNITGSLHIGHALDLTLQDILVRYHRMLGYETLWLPGTDHASIATHARIEALLASEGTSRRSLGREKFLERAWQWKDKYGHIITDQMKAMGASCDWSRERFTMDEGCSRAVTEVFVRLYEKGLIYKGDYMVNFCPACHTVISDIEVEHQETDGSLYHVRYPLNRPEGGFVEVATTRPETMLGDTAIAVNPEDERYKDLVGQEAILPLIGRKLPIIADSYVDPAFGTGAVKMTPAHDPNDFEIGHRHNLEFVTVIDTYGKMTDEAGPYAGLDRYECRKRIVKDLEDGSYLVKVEPYKMPLGHCHRCNTAVEPLISKQWFVRMQPLAEPALKAVREGKVTFVPDRFTRVYENWMENIRDWCISRQLWWGHRIPAWYCQDCGKMMVTREAPPDCPDCGGPVKQDEDVLDTWFSSGLWPFSTLGWPEKTPDLDCFFPTDVLVTGYDIIFFWVARMIFMSLEFTGKEPFKYVVLHGMVKDAQGRTMSKSQGTGIDPLVVTETYGTDALRLSLVTGSAMGNDMRLFPEKIEGARNFCNKLWNASRYCLSNLTGSEAPAAITPKGTAGRWILSRLDKTVQGVRESLDRFEPGDAINLVTSFVWDEFCDWYIEISKRDLGDLALADETRYVLWKVLRDSLALLHPFIPFLTEELWAHLPGRQEGPEGSLAISPYPSPETFPEDREAQGEMEELIETIKTIRNMRAEVNIPTGQKARVILVCSDPSRWQALSPYIQGLAWTDPLEITTGTVQGRHVLTGVTGEVQIYLPLEGIIDIDKEIERLEKSIGELEKELERAEGRLSNQDFLSKAPQEIIEAQKRKQGELRDKIGLLRKRVQSLSQTKGALQ